MEQEKKKPFIKRRRPPVSPEQKRKTFNRKVRDIEHHRRQFGIEAQLKEHKSKIIFVVYNAQAEHQIVELFASYQRAEDYCIKNCHPWGDKGGLQIRKVFMPEINKEN